MLKGPDGNRSSSEDIQMSLIKDLVHSGRHLGPVVAYLVATAWTFALSNVMAGRFSESKLFLSRDPDPRRFHPRFGRGRFDLENEQLRQERGPCMPQWQHF